MKHVSITRHSPAPAAALWAVLTDPAALVALDTGITHIDGFLSAGGRFRLAAEISGARRFKIRVTGFEPPHRMAWSSGGGPMFRGERVFTLTTADIGTTFEMTETFSGLMLPLIWRSMPDLTPSFARFADAVLAHAERKPR